MTTYSLGTGVLLATTIVHVTPDDVREPNELGFVRFDSGVQAIAQLGDSDLSVGDHVVFAGEHVLRCEGGESIRGPRLVATEDREQ
ncbi:OB-fold domain-containing protein [Halorussus salinisoli]|uniref:OB-fold domain-containing protein n=1 Tax=Halorussus salinisoli TaxID=2558242 RepID=UPI0010C16BC4|nr:OB-fold domain-containing protein [Halorussus salinisoli]